jgi:hypothetical protein
MQKPEIASAALQGQRGSVLVAVVTFSILIAIGTLGYMSMSGSTTNHEYTALQDAKAFHAAESGLLIGTRWLRDSTNWDAHPGNISNVFGPDSINDMNVHVNIIDSGTFRIVESFASGRGLGYVKKKLSWGIEKIGATNPGIFVNNLGPLGGVGGGGLNNTYIDGPFHSNTPIYLSAVSQPKADGSGVKFVNGPVTTYNKTIHSRFYDNQNKSGTGHMGEYGGKNNNYDFGIYHQALTQGTYQADKLDAFFGNTFTHSRDSLYMPHIVGQDILLPPNDPMSGKRAILYFDVNGTAGQATYYYYNAAGALQEPISYPVNGKVIRAQNEISVLGTVKGAATVVTNPGYNIYPVGDLKYEGFVPANANDYSYYDNTSNYGIGSLSSNANILALASGGDIHFQSGNKKTFNTSTKSLQDATGTDANTMYVTAQLIAIEHGMTTMFDTYDKGIETRDSKDFKISDYNYTLRCIGSRTIDWWFSYDAQGQGNEKIRFFYDTRLNAGLKAPGVPAIQSGDGDKPLYRVRGDWREQNLTS